MQLIGRLWRRPQAKRVLVYRLLAKNSPDEFLTNLSYGKGVMHERFLERPALGECYLVLCHLFIV